MPTLVAMAGLDPLPGAPTFPPCAPDDISNMRFYNAMAGNRWFLNATHFGHADFFEPSFQDLIDVSKKNCNLQKDDINFINFLFCF
jgi:hypothetical protein